MVKGQIKSAMPSTVLSRLQRLRSLAFYLVVMHRGDYVCNQNDVRGYDRGDGGKSRVAYGMQAGQMRGARVKGPGQDAPFHMYFSDAKYDVIGTRPRERLKMTSLKSTPVLCGWNASWTSGEIAEAAWLLTLAQQFAWMPVQKHPARSFFARYVLCVDGMVV